MGCPVVAVAEIGLADTDQDEMVGWNGRGYSKPIRVVDRIGVVRMDGHPAYIEEVVEVVGTVAKSDNMVTALHHNSP
jgi:hypothetical protein